MEQALIDLYRCPESFVKFDLIGRLSNEAGYFRFGQSVLLLQFASMGRERTGLIERLSCIFTIFRAKLERAGKGPSFNGLIQARFAITVVASLILLDLII
jgi:hypothetical protein